MTVYTYFNHIECLKDSPLVEKWVKSWEANGWRTRVLSEADVWRADTVLARRLLDCGITQTRNPAEYGRATVLRWVPMTATTENSLHVDWDVMCNGLKPEDVVIHDPVPTFFAGTCPCAVAASPRGWRLFASILEQAVHYPRFELEGLLSDSTDQYATSIAPAEFYYIDQQGLLKNYQEDEGWRDAKMIHFPNRLTPYPRSGTVEKELGI